MYPTMYLFKKSYIMLLIDLGRTTERPLPLFHFTYFLNKRLISSMELIKLGYEG